MKSGKPHENCYWVVQGKLLAGEYPGDSDVKRRAKELGRYVKCGITTFVDLTEEGEVEPYVPALYPYARKNPRIGYQRCPITDMGIPSRARMLEILDLLDECISRNNPVYVHCLGGIGRTGTVVGCYLVRHGRPGQAALDQLAELWQTVPKSLWYPRSPQTEAQEDFVRNWDEADGDSDR